MSEIRKKYEELYEKDAKALKADTIKELSECEKELGKTVEEPRAIAGPYSFTVSELIAQVEQETKIGRDLINGMNSLKATLKGMTRR